MESRSSDTWRCITSLNSNGIPVWKYRSTRTDLTVCMAQIPEEYPYKGVLDSLANRCLARGTNAWTDVDHTAYTISTAGEEAFLQILPVFLDHVLYPTLTDSGFVTEVHHINGEGEDAGVVYCEMQGRENTGPSLVTRALLRTIYPAPCGYRYETGGIMENLRSLTAEKVRQYHRQFYRPDNLCLIITGMVSPQKVFEALRPVEDKIVKKGALPSMQRPWTNPVPPFSATVEHVVEFPAEDDTTGGMVYFGWRAARAVDYRAKLAHKVLWRAQPFFEIAQYLTDSAVSPIQKEFIDIEEPLASKVSTYTYDNAIGVEVLAFQNVPTNQLQVIKPKLFALLEKVTKDGIDMERMASIIHRQEIKYLSSLEETPHDVFAFKFIGDFLYGEKPEDLSAALDDRNYYADLAKCDSAFWTGLIKSLLLDQPHVLVLGRPSTAYAAKLADDEKARIASQRQALGEAKLKELGERLEKAIEQNEQLIPIEIIERFQVPDPSRIPFIPVVSFQYGGDFVQNPDKAKALRALVDKSAPEATDCFVQFDHIPSNFVEMNVFIDTSPLPDRLRLYLELYLEIIFECPVERDGKLVKHDQVVQELTEDTVSYSNALGFSGSNFVCGQFAQLLSLSLKVERSKYEKGVQWLREFLWQSRFPSKRLKIGAKKLVKEVARHKRDGSKVVAAIMREVTFDGKRSNHPACSALRQAKFLQNVLKRLETDKQGVQSEFEEFRRLLCDPRNIRVQVIVDLEKVSNIKAPWTGNRFVPAAVASPASYPTQPVSLSRDLLAPTANSGRGELAGLPAIESGFVSVIFFDADIAPLLILIEYLTTMEGPFWKRIRGMGLSYGYDIRMHTEEGQLYFALSRSVSIQKAYHEARAILDEFVTGKAALEDAFLESAKSSVIFSIIAREETMSQAAEQAFLAYLKGTDNRALMERVKNVKRSDVENVLKKWLTRLFDPTCSNLAAAVNNTKVAETIAAFETENGRKLQEIANLEEFFVL